MTMVALQWYLCWEDDDDVAVIEVAVIDNNATKSTTKWGSTTFSVSVAVVHKQVFFEKERDEGGKCTQELNWLSRLECKCLRQYFFSGTCKVGKVKEEELVFMRVMCVVYYYYGYIYVLSHAYIFP